MRFRRVDCRQQGGCGGITESLEPLSTLEAKKKLVAQREDGDEGSRGRRRDASDEEEQSVLVKTSRRKVVVLGPSGRLGPIVRLTGPWALTCERRAKHVIT